MSTKIETPGSTQACAYCGSRIFDHDPICVRECANACGNPVYFCNYACLATYIDEQDLTIGDTCEWSPS